MLASDSVENLPLRVRSIVHLGEEVGVGRCLTPSSGLPLLLCGVFRGFARGRPLRVRLFRDKLSRDRLSRDGLSRDELWSDNCQAPPPFVSPSLSSYSSPSS